MFDLNPVSELHNAKVTILLFTTVAAVRMPKVKVLKSVT